MSNFWDTWATRHRNWRAAFVAVGFLAILAWGAVQMRSAKLTGTSNEYATVLEVKTYDLGTADTQTREGAGPKIYRGRLQLSDSTIIEMPLVSPIPKAGDKLPIVIELYDDGKKFYSIDRVKWQTGGLE